MGKRLKGLELITLDEMLELVKDTTQQKHLYFKEKNGDTIKKVIDFTWDLESTRNSNSIFNVAFFKEVYEEVKDE